MAEIKINQLESEKNSDEIIDLKAKSAKDSPEFVAFTTIRGGFSMQIARNTKSLNL